MAITNPNHKTNLFGFNIPNLLLYGLIALVIFVFFSLWKGIKNTFSSIFGSDSGTGIFGQSSGNQIVTSLLDRLKKSDMVKSNMTAENQNKAAKLLDAMQGMGTNVKAIKSIFDSITGQGQFAAIYSFYGIRKLTLMPSFLSFLPPVIVSNIAGGYEGDLIGALKSELSASDLDEKSSPAKQSIRYKIDNYLKGF